ncbi:39S ribosomal protein L47, mitochondrial [Ooceraea biroi]|nr:39S ribosomal protein L47, mitochondrial [Ooceraea biroi]
MLMTMEEACKQANEIFPNPERLDKVEISMKNLERVVRERNTAYHMLETGETGERPGKLVYNRIGMKYFYRMTEHPIPIFMNKSWRKKNLFGFKERSVRKFLGFYREKLWNEKRKARNREKRRVAVILRRFPNVDLEALKEQFPNVDIKAAKASKVARGHYAPE